MKSEINRFSYPNLFQPELKKLMVKLVEMGSLYVTLRVGPNWGFGFEPKPMLTPRH